MLWKAVKDILEIAGYNIASIEQELILDSKDGRTAGPPSGAAGYTSSIQQSKVVDLAGED